MALETFTSNRRRQSEGEKESNVDISIPGLARLTNPVYKKKKKAIWMIIVAINASICLFLTIDRLINYFEVPTTTKIDYQLLDYEMTFPQFTVCSTNLAFGFRTALQAKLKEQCSAFGLSNCSDEAIEEMSFQELNISAVDVWMQYKPNSVEIQLMGEEPINISESILNNIHLEKFAIMEDSSMFGHCVFVQHKQEIPYLSAATYLKVIVEEQPIKPNDEFFYLFIPHGVNISSLTTFEFLSNEFAIIPFGFTTELTLYTSKITFINTTNQPCYNKIDENIRLQECAVHTLERLVCKEFLISDAEKECDILEDFTAADKSQFSYFMKELRENCQARDVCEEERHHPSIDYVRPTNKNQTILVIKIAESIEEIKETYSYIFPSLVSDLFAYWGFFLSLSALVFMEIFEYFMTSLYNCIKNWNKKGREDTQY